MKIKALTTIDTGHRMFKIGELAYFADDEAQALIDSGSAELVLPPSLRPLRITLIADAEAVEMPAGLFNAVSEQPGSIDTIPTRTGAPRHVV